MNDHPDSNKSAMCLLLSEKEIAAIATEEDRHFLQVDDETHRRIMVNDFVAGMEATASEELVPYAGQFVATLRGRALACGSEPLELRERVAAIAGVDPGRLWVLALPPRDILVI